MYIRKHEMKVDSKIEQAHNSICDASFTNRQNYEDSEVVNKIFK